MKKASFWNGGKEWEGREILDSPVGSDDGVAADVDTFRSWFLMYFRKGGSVLLFLQHTTHDGIFPASGMRWIVGKIPRSLVAF